MYSHCGNGEVSLLAATASLHHEPKLATCAASQVTVTAHPASSLDTGVLEQQWRVLRFNDTRQSVSRVVLDPDYQVPQADAASVAFEYLKTMASVGQAAKC